MVGEDCEVDGVRIYIASSWRNEFQSQVVARLRELSYEVYDFKGLGDGWGSSDAEGPGGFGWSEIDCAWQEWSTNVPKYLEGLRHPRAIEGFNRDMDALKSADVCVMVMPCGPSASMEMGWAAGAGLHTIVYIPAMREPDLMVLMADLVTNRLDLVMDYLDNVE